MNSPMTKAVSILVLGALLIACSDGSDNSIDQGPTNPFAGFVSATYSDVDNWLCHPSLTDADNVCASNLDSTAYLLMVLPRLKPTSVKPTQGGLLFCLSHLQRRPRSQLRSEEGPEEIYATLGRGARYSRFCRMFAPVYRSETILGA